MKSSILKLNADCLLHILSYLDLYDLVNVLTISGVTDLLGDLVPLVYKNHNEISINFWNKSDSCKKMDALAKSSQVLGPKVQRLEARYGYTSGRIEKLLINCTHMENLQHLHIEDFNLLPSLHLLSNVLGSVKTLNLIKCQLSDEIGIYLKKAKHLVSLNLSHNSVRGSFLPNLKNLLELDISGCCEIKKEYFSKFCRGNDHLKKLCISERLEIVVKSLRNLESLKFQICNSSICYKLDILCNLANLKCLEIRPLFIDHFAYQDDWNQIKNITRSMEKVETNNVLKVFAANNRLEHLCYFVKLQNDDLEALTQFTNLKVLILYVTRGFTTHGFNDSILEQLSCKKSLQHLSLWGAWITDQGVCDFISECPSLEYISLKCCMNISQNLEKKLKPLLLDRQCPIKIITKWNYCQKRISTRMQVGMVMFVACFYQYMMRVNMSMNILAMRMPRNTSEKVEDYGERFEWSANHEGLILGAYFYGFMLSSLPGGFLSLRFGPKHVCFVTMVMSILLTVFTPYSAKIGFGMIFATRFFVGIFGGPVLSCIHHLIANWAPPDEKSKFVTLIEGGTLAVIFTWQLLGVLVTHIGYAWGGFHVPAIITTVIAVFWLFIVYDDPQSHPRISAEERDYIQKSLEGSSLKKGRRFPPIKAIATSIPFISLIILHYGSHWGLFFYLTAAPKYMTEVLGFKLTQAGFLSTLPSLMRFISSLIFGVVGDFIYERGFLTTTKIRKIFVIVSHILPGMFLLCLSFVKNTSLAVALMSISLGFNGACVLTNLSNCQDLAPNYAGTLYGIMNTITTTAGFIAPLAVAAFTKDDNSMASWRNVFILGAFVYIVAAVFFMIFGTGKIQPWNNSSNSKKNEMDEIDLSSDEEKK
ncbi:sialin-like [Sergentomyia squamirostris]